MFNNVFVDDFLHEEFCVCKKTDNTWQVVYNELQEQGLSLKKTKEFTFRK